MPSPVLAVGIDAADSDLVLRLIEGGELPALARLREDGSWRSVRSPASIGSGAVWPTFFTASEPVEHGVHGGWAWRPDAMTVSPLRTDRLRPFWSSLEDQGVTVGVVDVPFAPHVGLSRGFELTEWGSHDILHGRATVSPPAVAPAAEAGHPFTAGRLRPAGEDDRVELAALASGCVEGAAVKGGLTKRLLEDARPELAVVVFGEVHRAAHDLWQTVEPAHPLYEDLTPDDMHPPLGLIDVFREVDRQIGRLIDAAGDDAAVVVFSLHGMRPCRGVAVNLLGPVLREVGFAAEAPRARRPTSGLARGALAAVKRRAPSRLKRLYHRHVPRDARNRLAAPTMLPVLDWNRTRAFSLPSDQHGWVRLNLRGREAEGCVDPQDYERTCDELRDALEGLCTEDGRALVRDVVAADQSGAPPALLPDLVVHWSDAAFDLPVRVRGTSIEAWPVATRITGQHRAEGFCLARGLELPPQPVLEAVDVPRLLLDAAAVRPPS